MTFAIELDGRKALVTGGGQGVGKGICEALASAGAEVLVNDFVPDRANEVAEALQSSGGRATAVPFDVSDYGAVDEAVGSAGVDILVNNAGNAGPEGWQFVPFSETKPEEWERYFKVNLYGVMNCTRVALPNMIDKGWGRVVTIISDAGRVGEPRMAAYSAAKAGAAGFTRSVARDMGRHGVTLNNVALASMDPTGQMNASLAGDTSEDAKKRLRPYIIRRMGTPSDVANLVTFLVSPLSPWITGQTYPVNGGYSVNQ
jgi:NAD(P)-dependent dehydrogenase (short-subunit alcohol dehydrogenase family)